MNLKEFFDAVEQLKKEALPEHLNCNAIMVVNNTAIILEPQRLYLTSDGIGASVFMNANLYDWEKHKFYDPAENLNDIGCMGD